MNGVPPDQRRDSETMSRLMRIAGRIFQRYGEDFASARRAGGYSNATWLGKELALRVSIRREDQTILREARLASLFPPEVGYPPILETGVIDGFEWSLSKVIPGRNLGEVWPELDWDQRIEALRQLWKKVEAVHSVDVAAAPPWARSWSMFYPADPEQAWAGLARLQQEKLISIRQVKILEEALDRFWSELPKAALVLNHGDFTIENALWHEGNVVSLMDFEYALIAPDEVDANELLKSAFAPGDVADPLPDPGNAGLERMRQAVVELSMPMISHPGSNDLLMGYAILLEIWMLQERLAHPEPESGVDQGPLYQILGSLADGAGGYLAPVFRLAHG